MIVFGYAFDLGKLTRQERDIFNNNEYGLTCYTTGAGKIDSAMFGVPLETDSFLFCPRALSSLKLEATDEDRKELERAWAKLPEPIRLKAYNQQPDVFAFDNTDD